MNKVLQLLIIVFFVMTNLFGLDIPVNSVQKGDVTDWLFMGPIKENSDSFGLIGKIEKDHLNYFSSINTEEDLKIISVESKIIFGGQFYYQLYDIMNKGDIIFAFSHIDSRKAQDVVFDNNSAEGSFEVFLNGNLVKNVTNKREFTNVSLKKGLNDVLLKIYPNNYNISLTNLYHRFFFSIIPDSKFSVKGIVRDKNGSPIPFANVRAWDNTTFHDTKSDSKGFYEFLFFPISDNYQLTSSKNNYSSYSKVIPSKSGLTANINLDCNISSKFSGNVYMLDGDTPNAGIAILMEKINSDDNFKNWHAQTDENGKFEASPNIGEYNICYFADNKKQYLLDGDGKKMVISFDGKNDIEKDLTISNQVKGSWKKIDLFNGMLSNGVYDLLIGSDGLLYIATYNGLSIYDGQSVTSYNFKQGLPNSYINQLFEDSEGNLWLGYEYLGVVKWKNGLIEHIDYKKGLVGNSVRAINQDKDGNMLFGTERGLSIYDGSNFKNLNYSDGLGNGGVNAIEVDGKNIWLGGVQPAGTLTLYNGTALKNFDIPQKSKFGMSINDIKKGPDGKIWFTDQNKGLFSYDGQNFKNYTNMDGLPDNQANDLYIEDNETIWVTTGNGAAVFNGETFKTIWETDNDDALSFGNSSAVAKSKDGVFFFGQGNRGVII